MSRLAIGACNTLLGGGIPSHETLAQASFTSDAKDFEAAIRRWPGLLMLARATKSIVANVNGKRIFPSVAHQISPPGCGRSSMDRTGPALGFTFKRQALLRMFTVMGRCSRRSTIALAMTRSTKNSPQAPKLRLLVRIIGPPS